MPRFILERAEGDKDKRHQEDEKKQSEIDKFKDDLNKKEHEKQVDCLCVHGTCKKGESKCDKCFEGWTGTRCDLQKTPRKNINKKDGESSLKGKGKRMSRDRS